MVSLRNVDVRDASVETGFGDRTVLAARCIRKKTAFVKKTAGNSEKQRAVSLLLRTPS
jgi:hypothetical protein